MRESILILCVLSVIVQFGCRKSKPELMEVVYPPEDSTTEVSDLLELRDLFGENLGEILSCEPASVTLFVTLVSDSPPVYIQVPERIRVEQKVGSSWQEIGTYAECITTCDECTPLACEYCPDAVLMLQAGSMFSLTWDGYELQMSQCYNPQYSQLSCIEKQKVPAGHYRIGICYSTEYELTGDPAAGCYDVESGYINNATLKDPVCSWAEFDYSVCDPVKVSVEIPEL